MSEDYQRELVLTDAGLPSRSKRLGRLMCGEGCASPFECANKWAAPWVGNARVRAQPYDN
jgi:hypothetical protein